MGVWRVYPSSASPRSVSAIERQAQTKSEFGDGEMFAMAGGSGRYSHLAMKACSLLDARVPPGCTTFSSDMRIRIAATGQQTYADSAVVCGQAQPKAKTTSLQAHPDRRDPFTSTETYQMIPSLRDYLLVHQDRHRVEHLSKLDDGSWNLRIRAGNEGSM